MLFLLHKVQVLYNLNHYFFYVSNITDCVLIQNWEKTQKHLYQIPLLCLISHKHIFKVWCFWQVNKTLQNPSSEICQLSIAFSISMSKPLWIWPLCGLHLQLASLIRCLVYHLQTEESTDDTAQFTTKYMGSLLNTKSSCLSRLSISTIALRSFDASIRSHSVSWRKSDRCSVVSKNGLP